MNNMHYSREKIKTKGKRILSLKKLVHCGLIWINLNFAFFQLSTVSKRSADFSSGILRGISSILQVLSLHSQDQKFPGDV